MHNSLYAYTSHLLSGLTLRVNLARNECLYFLRAIETSSTNSAHASMQQMFSCLCSACTTYFTREFSSSLDLAVPYQANPS